MKGTRLLGVAACSLLAIGASAQQQPNTSTSEKMNSQPSAETAAKSPAGVSNPSSVETKTQGVTDAQTGCKSASAEMTNGQVETCKP